MSDYIRAPLFPLSNAVTSSLSPESYPVSAKAHLDGVAEQNAVSVAATARHLPFNVTPAELERINKVMSPFCYKLPDTVTFGAGVMDIVSAHPLAAIAHDEAIRQLDMVDWDLEIGASPQRLRQNGPTKTTHTCNLLDSRQQARILRTLNVRDGPNVVNMQSEQGCNAGAQHCRYQAKKIIGSCIHDIGYFDELPQIMLSHGATEAWFSIVAPPLEMLEYGGVDHDTGFRFERAGNRVRMFFKGDCQAYEHDYDNWMAWLTCPGINYTVGKAHIADYGPTASFDVEIQKRTGPIAIVHVVRVTAPGTAIHHANALGGEFVEVPDFAPVMKELLDLVSVFQRRRVWRTMFDKFVNPFGSGVQRLRKILAKVPFIRVPRQIETQVMSAAISQKDTQISRNFVANILTATMYQITVGNSIVHTGYSINGEAFNRLHVALTLVALLRRRDATKLLAAQMNCLFTDSVEVESYTWGTYLKRLLLMTSEERAAQRVAELWTGDQWWNEILRSFAQSAQSQKYQHTVVELAPDTYYIPRAHNHETLRFEENSLNNCAPYAMGKVAPQITVPPGPDLAQFQQLHLDIINRAGRAHVVSPLKVMQVGTPHAYVQTESTRVCRHGKLMDEIVFNKHRIIAIPTGTPIVREYREDTCAGSNFAKTASAARFLKRATVNACAAPYNDHAYWEEHPTQVEHWSVPIPGQADRPQILRKDQELRYRMNVRCRDCITTIGERDVYMDLGMDGSDEYLAASQAQVLRLLAQHFRGKRNTVIVKLQRFIDTIVGEHNGDLIQALEDYTIMHDVENCTSSERLAVLNTGFAQCKARSRTCHQFTDAAGKVVYDYMNVIGLAPSCEDYEHSYGLTGSLSLDCCRIRRMERAGWLNLRYTCTHVDVRLRPRAGAQNPVLGDDERFDIRRPKITDQCNSIIHTADGRHLCHVGATKRCTKCQKLWCHRHTMCDGKSLCCREEMTPTVEQGAKAHLVYTYDADVLEVVDLPELPEPESEEETTDDDSEETTTHYADSDDGDETDYDDDEPPPAPEAPATGDEEDGEATTDDDDQTTTTDDDADSQTEVKQRLDDPYSSEERATALAHTQVHIKAGSVGTTETHTHYWSCGAHLTHRHELRTMTDQLAFQKRVPIAAQCPQHMNWQCLSVAEPPEIDDEESATDNTPDTSDTGSVAETVSSAAISAASSARNSRVSTSSKRKRARRKATQSFLHEKPSSARYVTLPPNLPGPVGSYMTLEIWAEAYYKRKDKFLLGRTDFRSICLDDYECTDKQPAYTCLHPRYKKGTVTDARSCNLTDLANWYAERADRVHLDEPVQVYVDLPKLNEYDHPAIEWHHGHVFDLYQRTIDGRVRDVINSVRHPIVQPAFKEVTFNYTNVGGIKSCIDELAKEDQAEFKTIHAKIANILRDVRYAPRKLNVIEGTYGCGKTYYLKRHIKEQNYKSGEYIIVCPSNDLANDIDPKNAKSWSKAVLFADAARELKAIYIDEGYKQHVVLLAYFVSLGVPVYLIGDPEQMMGGGKNYSASYPPLATLLSEKPPRLNVAFNTPLDVVHFFNATAEAKTYSRSRIITSVFLHNVHNLKNPGEVCKVKCKTDHEHRWFATGSTDMSRAMQMPTFAAIQGRREKHFNLWLDHGSTVLMREVQGQKLVAMTRHTETLDIWTGYRIGTQLVDVPAKLAKDIEHQRIRASVKAYSPTPVLRRFDNLVPGGYEDHHEANFVMQGDKFGIAGVQLKHGSENAHTDRLTDQIN